MSGDQKSSDERTVEFLTVLAGGLAAAGTAIEIVLGATSELVKIAAEHVVKEQE